MNRRGAQLDAMLCHLGAAYYESLHGRASTSDVARALHAVGERSGEQAAEKRRDLLSVFVRSDTDIADEVRAILTDILLADPAQVNVTVEQGIVILSGHLGELERPDLISVAVQLTWDVDGVVDVVNKLPFRSLTERTGRSGDPAPQA